MLAYNPNLHNQIRWNQLTRFHTQINKVPKLSPSKGRKRKSRGGGPKEGEEKENKREGGSSER